MSDNNDQPQAFGAGTPNENTPVAPASGPDHAATAPTTPLPAELAAALTQDNQPTMPLGGYTPPQVPQAAPQVPQAPQGQPTQAQQPAQPQAPRPPFGAPQTSPFGGQHAPFAPQTPGAPQTPNTPQSNAFGQQPSAFGTATHLPPGAPVPLQHQAAGGQPPLGPTAGQAPAAKSDRPRRRVGATIGLIAACGVIAAGAGFGGSWAYDNFASGQARPVVSSEGGTITVNNPGSVTETTAIAAEALPSVVTINVSAGSSGGGSGSGVILSEDGYVLTNTHVVTLDGATGAADISVTTSDGRIFTGEVVGTDPTYDLAVIKLKDASGLKPITWGDSGKLNVGDTTVALGAPLGLSNTVTEGIVSNLNRSIQVASSAAPDTGEKSTDPNDQGSQGGPFTFDVPGQSKSTASESISIAVIQTDAAINPGNSGGALVNSQGHLIGINVAIATAGGNSSSGAGSIGVGFSIPSNIAKRISDEIIANGKATHGLLGASVQAASTIKGATVSGAYIAEVIDGGAAKKAGLQQGDVVTKLGSAAIFDATDLTAQVRALAGGADTTITYVRNGETYEADVTLGTL